jgi:hypothetical protein
MLQRKQRRYARVHAEELTCLARSDPGRFWREFKPSVTRACPVPDDVMVQHFKGLLGGRQAGGGPQQAQVPGALVHDSGLGSAFTVVEVEVAIRTSRGGKATMGSLKLNALAAASEVLAPVLAAAFNACWRVGVLPATWALCGITPIPKSGDPGDAGNYRGIAVGSLLAKLYASMLNRRLMGWAEQHGVRARGQAGFRRDYRTTDQVFVLRTLIEQARATRAPLYVCFVDFQKAYDSVPRDLLWGKLQRVGVTPAFVRAVQALYADVPMCVRFPHGLSETFATSIGVKQGCPLSPTLFGIYIDDLQAVVDAGAGSFELPSLQGVETPALLYADDLALVSLSAAGLQAQLDALAVYSQRWRLTVNVAKTKAVVFSHACRASPGLGLMYGGANVEVVGSFRYLGVDLHATSAFASAAPLRAESAKRALLALLARCRRLRLHQPKLLLELYTLLVRPTLLYGAEVWAPGTTCDAAMQGGERVLRRFLRQLLGVRTGTPCAVLLGETGCLPMAHTAAVMVAQYWNRLVRLPEGRLAKQAFMASLSLRGGASSNRNPCWASQVVSMFGCSAPVVDGVPCVIDIRELGKMLQSRYISSVNASPLAKVQRWLTVRGGHLDVATSCQPEPYLSAVPSRAGRRRLAQLRTGSHWLRCETGRWAHGQRLERADRLCLRCSGGDVDDEAHMVWGCPALIEQRLQHVGLFNAEADTLAAFLGQEPCQVAAFVRDCHRACVAGDDVA